MINREWKQVTVSTFGNTTDSYGQLHKNTPISVRTIDMVIKVASQNKIDNPIYAETTEIGITKDKQINRGDEVQVGTDKFLVLYRIESPRLNQVLLKRLW